MSLRLLGALARLASRDAAALLSRRRSSSNSRRVTPSLGERYGAPAAGGLAERSWLKALRASVSAMRPGQSPKSRSIRTPASAPTRRPPLLLDGAAAASAEPPPVA